MLSALYRLTQRMGVSMAAAPGINDHDDDASIDSLSSVPSEASQEDGSQEEEEEDKESALSPNQPENTNAPSLHSRTVKDEPSETFPGFHIRDIRRLNSPHIDHIYYRPEHPEIIVRSTPGVQRIIDTMQSMKMEYREACDYLVDLGFKSYFKGVAWSKEKKRKGENRKQLSRAEGEGQQTQSLQDLGEGPSSRKSSRFTSVETAAALDSASPSSEVKSSPVKSSDVKPPRKKTPQQNTKSNSQSVSTNKSSSTTNKPSPHYSDATLHSAHWTRGPHTHDRKSRRWISPTHKISFRYRKDAELFEGMRRKCGGDEVEAWSEYTTHKYHAKQNREVLNPYNVDKQLGLDVDALRRQNNPDNFTGEGWEMIMSGTKRCWRSPVRKMVFRKRYDAHLFEKLRKKYGADEIQAWVEYTNIKESLGEKRMVTGANKYDIGVVKTTRSVRSSAAAVPSTARNTEAALLLSTAKLSSTKRKAGELGPKKEVNARKIPKQADEYYYLIDRNWTRGHHEHKKSKYKTVEKFGTWISPVHKMEFQRRMDALTFEALRQENDGDETKAWIEYTKIKYLNSENRLVLDCNRYDEELGVNVSLLRRKLNPDNQIGQGWEVVTGGRTKRTRFISPARKMVFHYRNDAQLFESLRQKYGVDEIQAWIEYTKIKHARMEKRYVDNARVYDCGQAVAAKLCKHPHNKRKNDRSVNAEEYIGPGWDVVTTREGCRQYKRTRYISPVRKMVFHSKNDAEMFESLRQKHKGDEFQAWVEMKHGVNTDRYHDEICKATSTSPQTQIKFTSLNTIDKGIGPGWEFGKAMNRSKHSVIWISPTRKIPFTNRKDALVFQTLRIKHGIDEIQAWVEYTNIKSSKNEPRNVIECHKYDRTVGYLDVSLRQNDNGDGQLTGIVSSSFQDSASSKSPSNQTRSAISNIVSDEESEFYFPDREVNVNWTRKQFCDRILDLKMGFTSAFPPTIMETTIGALWSEKEEAALFEDNPQIAPVDREISKGYTGLQALNSLPKPPNGRDSWEPPILLYGDFDGIKLYDSASDFLCDKRQAYISMGEEHGQATVVVVCQFIEVSESTANAPCCFLGYESGCVAALTASLSAGGRSYNFSVERHRHVHNSKVSALTIMDCKSTSDSGSADKAAVLLSACYDGQVFYYPNSLNPNSSFDMKQIFAFSNSHPDHCPILGMSSTTFIEDNREFSLVCTGDRAGSVKLYLASDGLLENKLSNETPFIHIKWYKSKGKHCVTMAKFVNSQMLVSGNRQGDIRIWNLATMHEIDEDSDETVPGLTLSHLLKHAHNGPVETVMNLGDVIITSGGNDGNLIGWDATRGKKLGTISCHYGQETFDANTGEKGLVKSCVVGAQVVDKRLISLCRDGVLAEWKFV